MTIEQPHDLKFREEGRHIYLVGLPGSGKSTIGRLLADALGLPYYCLDHLIEDRAGRLISEIFADSGESFFRDLETEVLAQISRQKPGIVATGGGVVLRPANITVMRASGTVIWLDRTPAEIEPTLAVAERPVLANAVGTLASLSAQRRPLYEASATYVVRDAARPADTLARIQAWLADAQM